MNDIAAPREPLPKILYIDDDEGLRRLTRRALQRAGFEVLLAANGTQGVSLCADQAFDLVAVDHYMPGMDGLETLAALHKLPYAPPVIYVTGSDESRLAVAALKAGAIDYVVKSATNDYFDLLVQAIRNALTTEQLWQEKEQAEARLHESNARLQALLKEVNHRVANSLQLVSSFVHMQSRALDDKAAQAALADTQRRIAAISQVHKRLYTSDTVDYVDMSEYLDSLVEELNQTWSTPVAPRHILLASDAIHLATDKAVAVGIILTELVTNACKYAYGPSDGGEVRVHFSRDDAQYGRLVVEDDGCGMSIHSNMQGTGLGSKLIGAMATTLKGSVFYEQSNPGVRAVLLTQI